jgi:hypothetical protein
MKGITMKKIVLIASGLYVGYLAVRVYLEMHTLVLLERFPDLPEQAVRKAHKIMLKRALTDPNFEPETEEEMDAYMRNLVKEMTP